MNWEELEAKCLSCEKCELCKTRKNVVFGAGSREAKIMFIGEAPGANEDESGVPFVGRAGKLFDLYLQAVSIPRESIYIANMLKCRPPQNRDPLPAEQNLCIEYLFEQIRLIKPRIIVCLGRISAMRLIKPDFRIMKEHGEWFKFGDIDICAVYHPSLLLRDPRHKEDMLLDMRMIKERLNLLSE